MTAQTHDILILGQRNIGPCIRSIILNTYLRNGTIYEADASIDIRSWRRCSHIPSLPRLVLSAASDYFAAMFTNDVREAKQEEIKMEGVDPDALKDLVRYAYTGKGQVNFLLISDKVYSDLDLG